MTALFILAIPFDISFDWSLDARQRGETIVRILCMWAIFSLALRLPRHLISRMAKFPAYMTFMAMLHGPRWSFIFSVAQNCDQEMHCEDGGFARSLYWKALIVRGSMVGRHFTSR